MTDGRGVLATLFRFEVRMLLRDRRFILVSVVLPVVVLPALIFLMERLERSREEELETATYTYAIAGPEAGRARALLERALRRDLSAAEEDRTARFQERRTENPDSLLGAGEIQVVVEGVAPDTSDAVPVLRLRYRSNSERSSAARRQLRDRLRELRDARRDSLLRARGLSVDPDDLARVRTESVASAEEEGGAVLGLILTPLLVFLMMTGGSVVAADSISGEKERGTLETMLTTAARRSEIVAAKQLTIIAVGAAIILINVANVVIYIAVGLFELPEGFAVAVSPAAIVVLLLLYLPLTVLVAAVLLLLSGYARSYKEYQIYFFPVMLLFLAPVAAGLLPGMELRSIIAFVPLANVSVAVREVLVGEFDPIFLPIALAVTVGVAAFASRLTSRLLSTERLITAADTDEAELVGGPALFPKRVLTWFGLLWVALFLSSLWLGGDLGIRGQVVFNVVGLFFGGAVLMMWRYRLDPRTALALRPVPAPVWAAVLIGAPSAYLVGLGVFRAANLVFPVPERMLESFGQFLLPQALPLWQVLLFLCVLPGVFEEIAFRGVLLHGLRRRFNPVVLCLVVGAIFGLFHVQLFRLVPTAYLGVVLAGVVMITGSIFPAMLWHALNNAMGLVPAYLGAWEEMPPVWTVAPGVVGLGLSFWILWRYRSLYPGLRPVPPGPPHD